MTTQLTCLKCNHQWIPRVDNVKCCPRCKGYLNRNKKEESPVSKFEEPTGSITSPEAIQI